MSKVLYHANCPDGFTSAYIAYKHLGDKAEYIPMNYGQELDLDKIEVNEDIYILDFSFSLNAIEKLLEKTKYVILLDHHKTAEKDLMPLVEKYKDNATTVIQ